MIDNKKVTQLYNDAQDSKLNVTDKLSKNMRGNEILVLSCYKQPKQGMIIDDPTQEDLDSEGFILVGGNSVNIQVYSIRTGLLVTEMEGHTDSITAMVIDGNILITGSDDHSIRLWNLGNFTPSGIVGTHEHAV